MMWHRQGVEELFYSVALKTVMMSFVVSYSSAWCLYYFKLANFPHNFQNLPFIYEGCHSEFHLYLACILQPLILYTYLLSD